MNFTHYYTLSRTLSRGSYILLTVGTCERCGGLVQEPNALTANRLVGGLERLHAMPAEIWPVDGGYACDNCLEEGAS